jgi:Tol biopolymer transport system component
VFELFDESGAHIGSFYTDPNLGKPNRCGLHPRWSPDAREVCIDSIREGERQMYLVDVSALTARD